MIWYNSEGQVHRADGPAMITPVGPAWYLNGQPYTDLDKFCKDAELSGKDLTIFLLKYSHEFA